MNSPQKITVRTAGHKVSITLQGIDSLECLIGNTSIFAKKIVFDSQRDALNFVARHKYYADITCPLIEFICSKPRYAYLYSELLLRETGRLMSMIPGSLVHSAKYASKFCINVLCDVVPDFDAMIMASKYMPDYYVRCHLKHYGRYKVTKRTCTDGK
jgi:hypothetical protein